MTLRGLDTSSYQGGMNVAKTGVDFVITKATQGTWYVNPYCDRHISQAKTAKMERGVYHFADGGNPTSEADYFLKNVSGYIGDTVLALDFEKASLINSNHVSWAHEWLNRVYTRTDVRPLLYMPSWVYNAYDWTAVVKDGYGAWPAYWPTRPSGYTYGSLPKLKYWSVVALWQFTDSGKLPGWSGKVDLDIFTGDKTAWAKYAATSPAAAAPKPATPQPAPQPSPQPAPTTAPKGLFDVSDFHTMTRSTDQQLVTGDSKILRLDDRNNVSWGFAGGKFLATFRLALDGLKTGDDFRVVPYYVDTDPSGKPIGKPHDYPTVGIGGTSGSTWGQVVFDYDVPKPPAGHTRRLRLRGEYSGKKPITVTSINTTVRKAAL